SLVAAVPPAPPPQQHTPHPAQAGPTVPNHLVWAILATICCCLPTGIVSIIYAAQVDGKVQAGDLAGARQSSDNAKLWAWISFGLGLVGGAPSSPLASLAALADAGNYCHRAAGRGRAALARPRHAAGDCDRRAAAVAGRSERTGQPAAALRLREADRPLLPGLRRHPRPARAGARRYRPRAGDESAAGAVAAGDRPDAGARRRLAAHVLAAAHPTPLRRPALGRPHHHLRHHPQPALAALLMAGARRVLFLMRTCASGNRLFPTRTMARQRLRSSSPRGRRGR